MQTILLLGARKAQQINDLYNPLFFIPLMSMAFGPEAIQQVLFVSPKMDLLALTIAGLSSQNRDMRVASANDAAHFVDIDMKIWLAQFCAS